MDERVVVVARVEHHERLGVQIELPPGEDFEQFLEGAAAAGERHKGIGEAKAITIMAALELGKRRRAAEANMPKEVKNSKDTFERLLPYIDDPSQEHFLVMYLNQSNHPLKVECISKGGTTNVIADPKIIFKNALTLNATCIALGHNHPSGNPRPSEEDRLLTKKLVGAGKLLDISVVDHIIIGNECYYSFRDHGEMTF